MTIPQSASQTAPFTQGSLRGRTRRGGVAPHPSRLAPCHLPLEGECFEESDNPSVSRAGRSLYTRELRRGTHAPWRRCPSSDGFAATFPSKGKALRRVTIPQSASQTAPFTQGSLRGRTRRGGAAPHPSRLTPCHLPPEGKAFLFALRIL